MIAVSDEPSPNGELKSDEVPGDVELCPLVQRRRVNWIGLFVLLIAAVFYVPATSTEHAPGWDESMHALLPAARMAELTRAGEYRAAADVALECQQYPFVYPAYLASAMRVFGTTERVARRASRALWVVGIFAIALCARAVINRRGATDVGLAAGLEITPAFAALIALFSPMAMAFSGTLFMEVPFLTVSALALFAWLRRDSELSGWRGGRRELLAGALVACAFFTKFNYGLLLGFALTLDWLIEGVLELRGGRGARFARRSLCLAAVPLLTFAWWFLAPWPGGAEVAASHREAFAGFLGGNTDQPFTAFSRRLWDLGGYLVPGPIALALLLVGLLLSLRDVLRPGVRTLWLLLIAANAPVLAHPFHLERFLLPALLPLAVLSAYGWARSIGAAWLRASMVRPPATRTVGSEAARFGARFLPIIGGSLCFALTPVVTPTFESLLGIRTEQNAEYLDELGVVRSDIAPYGELPTAGLEREAYDGFVDAVAEDAGPTARIGWLGVSSELSPAALHFGLLARGGSIERFLRDAPLVRGDGQPDMVVTFLSEDPGWDTQRLRAWADRFDVVYSTAPFEWKGRRGREFLDRYRGMLFEDGSYGYTKIATVPVARPLNPPTDVELFACRKGS